MVELYINLLNDTGVIIVSLTFNGYATNINMVKQLDCNIDPKNFKTSFTLCGLTINIIPDPALMIKLVRNTFGEKNILVDDTGERIDFNYIKQLLVLQDNESFT